MRQVLFDSDVLLDVLAQRQPSEAASAAGVEIIVTRNTPDFASSSIPVALPEEFLAMPLE